MLFPVFLSALSAYSVLNGAFFLIIKMDGDKTIILASHNQTDIDELCDTVCEMDAGVMTMIR